MDLATLRSRVYSELSEEENRYFKDEDINYWLNVGQKRLATRVKHLKDTTSTSTATDKKEYPLPDDYIDHFKLKYGDVELDEVPESADNPEDSNDYGFYIWSDALHLNFYPDGTELKLWYYRTPEEMINDVDTPEVEIEYQDGLIQFALMKAKQKDEKYNQAQVHQRSFQQTLSEMMQRYSKEPIKKKWNVTRV